MDEHPVNICAMHDKKMSTVLLVNFASFLSLHTDDEHVDSLSNSLKSLSCPQLAKRNIYNSFTWKVSLVF